MKLKCPLCDYVWSPRVSSPKSCPKCKQPFKDGRKPIRVSEGGGVEAPRQEEVADQVVVGKNEKGGRVYGVCTEDIKKQHDVEAPYIFEDNVLCLYHLIEALLKYDDYYDYKKPDVIGIYEDHRRKFKDALRKVLEEHTSAPQE